MRATPSGLAEEIGWEPKAFAEAFREVLSKGMAEHDQIAHLIALPNFIKYNPPENPNVLKAWAGAVDLLPECGLKEIVLQRARAFAEIKGEAFAKAFREALPEGVGTPLANQEQEPEQEPGSQLSQEGTRLSVDRDGVVHELRRAAQ